MKIGIPVLRVFVSVCVGGVCVCLWGYLSVHVCLCVCVIWHTFYSSQRPTSLRQTQHFVKNTETVKTFISSVSLYGAPPRAESIVPLSVSKLPHHFWWHVEKWFSICPVCEQRCAAEIAHMTICSVNGSHPVPPFRVLFTRHKPGQRLLVVTRTTADQLTLPHLTLYTPPPPSHRPRVPSGQTGPHV